MRKLMKIDRLLLFSKTVTITAVFVAMISVLASLAYSFYLNKQLFKEHIYVLDGNGAAFSAKNIKQELMNREPEIRSHLTTFHKYFFNLDQYNYEENTNKALGLIDESGKNYYLNLFNSGWYSTLRMNSLVQEISFDSINMNADVYPYLASVYGKTNVYRYGEEINGTKKSIGIECKLFDVLRTQNNPHGLLISNYNILYHAKK
jgi:conjugative transposon TraK protein